MTVSVVEPPRQTSKFPVMLPVGSELTVIVFVAVVLQPFSEVTSTE